jgi:hypothetical protein
MLNLLPAVKEEDATPAGSASQLSQASPDVELGVVTARGAGAAPPTPAAAPARRRGLLRLGRLARRESADAGAPSEVAPSPAEVASRELHATAKEVNASIATIFCALGHLSETHSRGMQASKPEVVKELRARMLQDIAATSLVAAKVKRCAPARSDQQAAAEALRSGCAHASTVTLRQIEALAADARRAALEHGAGSAPERMRSTVAFALEVKFRDVMRDFSELRAVLQRDHVAVVARRYAAVVGHPPDEEELRQLAGDAPGDASERVFADALAAQGRAAEPVAAQAALAEVHERHDAIVELEKGLSALHQMFLGAHTARCHVRLHAAAS